MSPSLSYFFLEHKKRFEYHFIDKREEKRRRHGEKESSHLKTHLKHETLRKTRKRQPATAKLKAHNKNTTSSVDFAD
jgi:hypothetical protein